MCSAYFSQKWWRKAKVLDHLDLSSFLLQEQLLRQPLALQHLDLLGLPGLLLLQQCQQYELLPRGALLQTRKIKGQEIKKDLQCLVSLTKHPFLLPVENTFWISSYSFSTFFVNSGLAELRCVRKVPEGWEGPLEQFCKGLAHCLAFSSPYLWIVLPSSYSFGFAPIFWHIAIIPDILQLIPLIAFLSLLSCLFTNLGVFGWFHN